MTEKSKKNEKLSQEITNIIESPRICCIDIDENTILALKNKIDPNIYSGTLGKKVRVDNSKLSHKLLPNYKFPENLHEYDIIIIDLANYTEIEYQEDEHTRQEHTGSEATYFLSRKPETIFDPRPFGSFVLSKELDIISNKSLVIIFSSKYYQITYNEIAITNSGFIEKGVQVHHIYSFFQDNRLCREPKVGDKIIISPPKNNLCSFLGKYINGATYNQTFSTRQLVESTVLMTNASNNIVSFIGSTQNKGKLLMLPQIKEKSTFLVDFLSNFAPSAWPDLFPYSNKYIWKTEETYWLPKHAKLLAEKIAIQKEFEEKLKNSERQIQENIDKHSFLHEIISETGDILVKSLITYLEWLGFEKVIDFDETKAITAIKEEDIQVELEDGSLLIIECKGIGGTSTDADCSQINKVKFRRCKSRGRFDVKALYIVNHQRYLPPLNRKNPPFSEHQIKDAENDERGLLSTWQLFNLYSEIETGIITKEEARKIITHTYGLVQFRPDNLMKVYEPTEFFQNGQVCIVNIKNIKLNVNDTLFVEKDGIFEKVTINEIQVDEKSVQSASNGELGLKLSSKIKSKSILWKKNDL